MRSEVAPLTMESHNQRKVLGERFLRTFHRLIHSVKIHQDNNALLIECAKEFLGTLVYWWQEEEYLKIHISRGRFFLQDEKLLYRRQNVNLIEEMYSYLEKRKLGGLVFHSTLEHSSFEQLWGFIRVLNDAERQEHPFVWLSEKLNGGAFPWVELLPPGGGDSQARDLKRRERAKRTYAYALASVRDVTQKLTSQGGAGVRKIKRVVQNMVDLLSEDESVLLGMSTVRDYDDYTYTHSVNVAILSLCLGKHIGLSRLSLRRLGICGLVHDLGKLDVPLKILKKPGRLSVEEFREIEKHPLRSVFRIIRLRASSDLKAEIMLPPFEHHLKYDLSGYPRLNRKKPVSLLGRILAIADVFDAITSPRIYRPTAFSPDRALGMMLARAGKDFDPILLKAFVNMLGVYPLGTLLLLDTGEMGLVKGTPKTGDATRPRVVLLAFDGQGGFRKVKTVGLTERNPQTGLFFRNIQRTLHPSAYGIQPAKFLV
jgi:HD-GYP domain-containing protein (c-di-GMP phosphodiesterase class II)